jgi:hypothetical protein
MTGVPRHVPEVRATEDVVFRAGLMWPWIVGNSLAFGIFGALGGGVLRAMSEPWYGSHVSMMEAARIQATAAGVSSVIFWACAGTVQWLVVRRAIRAGWWMPVTVVGWAAAGVLVGASAGGAGSSIGPHDGPLPPLVRNLVVPPVIALLVGGGQWLILRREARNAAWWLAVNTGALAISGFVGLAVAKALPGLAGTQYPSARAVAVAGVVAGALYPPPCRWSRRRSP